MSTEQRPNGSPAAFTQTYDIVRWLLVNLTVPHVLTQDVHRHALALLDHVTLASHGIDRLRHLQRADAANSVLRVKLRLARDLELLDDRRLLYTIAELDGIGRQVGGWLKAAGKDSQPQRHR